jgi:hypothetical protein
MDLGKIELHDALLKSMAVDYAAKSVTVCVDFYEDSKYYEKVIQKRKPALIIFDNVESFSQVCNFEALQNYASSGNIVQWAPAKGSGTTYIDVVGGCIAINAKKVRFKLQK